MSYDGDPRFCPRCGSRMKARGAHFSESAGAYSRYRVCMGKNCGHTVTTRETISQNTRPAEKQTPHP